jgi:hypothetical protein
LAEALARNVYGGPDGGEVQAADAALALARYLAASVTVLDGLGDGVLAQGTAAFAPLPEVAS